MATYQMGFIGEVVSSSDPRFVYDLITPDFSQQPKRPRYFFTKSGDYPISSVLYYQRRVYISTLNNPATLFFSAVGDTTDFHETVSDTGSFQLDLDNPYFDPINHAVAVQFGVFLFGERNIHFVVSRDGGGASADNLIAKSELASGSKRDIEPLRILNNIIYISNLDGGPRSLVSVDASPNQYQTLDMALYSHHLFRAQGTFIEDDAIASSVVREHRQGAEIISMTYSGRVDRVLWAVRADGLLLSCTYAPEHDVNAWAKHATRGRFRDVQAVYEKSHDTVYCVVERGEHSYIECLSNEDRDRLEFSTPVDAAVTTDNIEPIEATALYIYDYVEGVKQGDSSTRVGDTGFPADYTGLGATIVGNGYTFRDDAATRFIRTAYGYYEIAERITNRTAKLTLVFETKDSPCFTAFGTACRLPIYHWEIVQTGTVFNGMHLADSTYTIVTHDGRVLQRDGVVDDHKVSIGTQGFVAGFPFNSHVEFLPLVVQEQVMENKPKHVSSLSLRCINSSSMKAGERGDTYPVFFDNSGDAEIKFQSGVFDVVVGTDWDLDKSLYVESTLPFHLLGFVASFDFGEDPNVRPARR